MKQLVKGSLIALFITLLAGIGFYYFQQYSVISANPTDAISSDAAVIIEFKNGHDISAKLQHADLWKSLCEDSGIQHFSELINRIDTLLQSHDNSSALWTNKNMLMSLHPTGNLTSDWLWTTDLPAGTNENKVMTTIENLSGEIAWNTREFENVKLHEIYDRQSSILCYAVSKGILLCSRSSNLVENAIRHLKNEVPLRKQKSFNSLYQTIKNSGEVRIYVNFKRLKDLWSGKTTLAGLNLLKIAGGTTDWVCGNLTANNSTVSINGTTSTDNKYDLLNLLSEQPEATNQLIQFLPDQTAVFMWFPFDSLQLTWQNLRKNAEYFPNEIDRKNEIRNIFSRINNTLPENLLDETEGECCIFITEPVSTAIENNVFIAVRTKKDVIYYPKVKALLSKLKSGYKNDNIHKPQYFSLSEENLCSIWFGALASGMKRTSIGIAGNLIVFGGQTASIQAIMENKEHLLLNSDLNLKSSLIKLNTDARLISYANCDRIQQLIRTAFDSATAANTCHPKSWLNDFSTALLMISGKKGEQHFEFQLNRSRKQIKPAVLSWATVLDTAIESGPFIIYTEMEHRDALITAQDAKHQLYLMLPSGTIRVKKPLPDAIYGKITAVDLFGNNTTQLMFATQKQLWTIDQDGNNAGLFPVTLPANVAGEVSYHFDGSGSVDKIYIPCTNGFIYAFEKDGRPCEKWQQKIRIDSTLLTIQSFDGNNECKLAAIAKSKLILVNESGKQIAFPSNQKFLDGSVFKGDSSMATTIALLNTEGDLFMLDTKKMTLSKKCHLPDSKHLATSSGGNMNPTIIVISEKQLTVIDTSGTIINNIKTPSSDGRLLKACSNSTHWSIADSKSDQLYLYNNQGRLIPGFPVKGSSGFDYLESVNYSGNAIVTGSPDGKISLYTTGE